MCWLSWLLKVTVRLPAEEPGTVLVEKRVEELRRLHTSMFWKQDFTLEHKAARGISRFTI